MIPDEGQVFPYQSRCLIHFMFLSHLRHFSRIVNVNQSTVQSVDWHLLYSFFQF